MIKQLTSELLSLAINAEFESYSLRWSFDKGVRGDGGTGGQNPTIGARRVFYRYWWRRLPQKNFFSDF